MCVRRTTQPPPASMTWPSISRRLHFTRHAISLHPHQSGPVCHHAAQTARHHPHCRVLAMQAPRTRNVDANATASPVAAPASRLTVVENAADTRMTVHQPVRASNLRAKVTARKSTRREGREGRKSSLLRIMRASQGTRIRSPGIKQLNLENTLRPALAEGREDECVRTFFGCFLAGILVEHIHCFLYTHFYIWAGLR